MGALQYFTPPGWRQSGFFLEMIEKATIILLPLSVCKASFLTVLRAERQIRWEKPFYAFWSQLFGDREILVFEGGRHSIYL